uniref:Uncharacterized protein n=1 Tax=Rhizophora mucronata TaxID=61149 RepID=A0A2P2QWP1_RHIMU
MDITNNSKTYGRNVVRSFALVGTEAQL